MPGLVSSAGSGPLTSMLSNATSIIWIVTVWITLVWITTVWITTACIHPPAKQTQRKGRLRRRRRGPNRERDKGETK